MTAIPIPPKLPPPPPAYEVNTAERIQLAMDGKLPKDQPITEYERECCLILAKTNAMLSEGSRRDEVGKNPPLSPEDYEENLMQHGVVR
jgi:hypothetical protein